jgi:hypothetical protein
VFGTDEWLIGEAPRDLLLEVKEVPRRGRGKRRVWREEIRPGRGKKGGHGDG